MSLVIAGSTLAAVAVVNQLTPDAPNIDMSGQNAAALQQASISKDQLQFAKDQAGKAEQRQALFDPKFLEIINQQLESSRSNDARSAQQWQQYTNLFMPAEQRLADTAANYDTPGRRAAAASEAVAGVDAQFQRGRDAQNRDLGRAGVSLTSGRALTLDSAQRFAQAKAAAGADRQARNQVEATGMSLTDNVAKFGRGLPSTGLEAARLALGGSQAAGGSLGQQQSTYNASLVPSMQGYNNASGSTQAAGMQFGNIAQTALAQQQMDNAGMAGLGQLAGTLGSAMIYKSDPKSKTVHGKVNESKARESIESDKVYDWTYKDGEGDGGRHIGRMAGSNDVDTPSGKAIDVASEFGLHRAAISDISKDVKAIKKSLASKGRSLSDASKSKRSA